MSTLRHVLSAVALIAALASTTDAKADVSRIVITGSVVVPTCVAEVPAARLGGQGECPVRGSAAKYQLQLTRIEEGEGTALLQHFRTYLRNLGIKGDPKLVTQTYE